MASHDAAGITSEILARVAAAPFRSPVPRISGGRLESGPGPPPVGGDPQLAAQPGRPGHGSVLGDPAGAAQPRA
jgi:hypothetical protein